MRVALDFVTAYWAVTAVVLALAFYAVVEQLSRKISGPKETAGNGIVIGDPKAFDNRALTLRIERLSAGLSKLTVVNQNVTDSLATLQGRTSSDSTSSITLDAKADKPGTTATRQTGVANNATPAAAGGVSADDTKGAVGPAAGDVLSDQLNLASQIVNLETLYERSLTDRLFNDRSRLQTVLGFQVSINPPVGFENCAAVAEVAVRMQDNTNPVSLVALIPQEKTYNSQSISNSSRSIEGSAVAQVVRVGFNSKGESRELFIHRDADTIAFERDPDCGPPLFADGERGVVFGWEFRPVLGRTTVSAGTRQMLAVVAVPLEESSKAKEVVLEIRTRTLWRSYNRKKQTSRPNWGWLPWDVNRARLRESAVRLLNVPNTAKIQHALAPTIAGIESVTSSHDRVTVIVKGANFFSGTKVTIGGVVHSETDGTLTLKSDQALEFDTTIASLEQSDAVLSGRFGSALPLAIPDDRRPVRSLSIREARVTPYPNIGGFRVSVVVGGADRHEGPVDLTLAMLDRLPEPILFIGTEPVPRPYDYIGLPTTLVNPNEQVRVEAWVSAKLLAMDTTIAFRIPFCGSDYASVWPLSSLNPTVTRMGAEGHTSVFRIVDPLAGDDGISIELDRTYGLGAQLARTGTDNRNYMFRVPTTVASGYQNVVVRRGTDSFLLPLPAKDPPEQKTTIDPSAKLQKISKGAVGPFEWAGTGLDAVVSARLVRSAPSTAGGPDTGTLRAPDVPAQFIASESGRLITIVFADGSTDDIGKADLQLQTAAGDTLHAPVLIVKA